MLLFLPAWRGIMSAVDVDNDARRAQLGNPYVEVECVASTADAEDHSTVALRGSWRVVWCLSEGAGDV
jgi:hypothetical protein